MAGSISSDLEIDWEVVSPAGPALAHHVGCLIGGSLYIHGGITKSGSNTPSDKLYRLSPSSGIWDEVRQPGSPALSHHCCVTLKNRYMLLIGGWNGSKRTSKVYAFDTAEQKWLFPEDTGFPEGAGLSSHTANVLSTGEILVIGREGSLRLQRKHGSVFLLRGDVEKGIFQYVPYSTATASRSGHTTCIVGNVVYIIGGRDDNFIEMHAGYTTNTQLGNVTSKFIEVTGRLKTAAKVPSTRKNHISVEGQGAVLIHGGETFDGRNREPVGEIYIVKTKPHLTFYKIGNSKVTRACHVCCSDGNRVLLHGGIAGRGTVYGDCYELKVKPQNLQMKSKQKLLSS